MEISSIAAKVKKRVLAQQPACQKWKSLLAEVRDFLTGAYITDKDLVDYS